MEIATIKYLNFKIKLQTVIKKENNGQIINLADYKAEEIIFLKSEKSCIKNLTV